MRADVPHLLICCRCGRMAQVENLFSLPKGWQMDIRLFGETFEYCPTCRPGQTNTEGKHGTT
jgi:hypothetical protein